MQLLIAVVRVETVKLPSAETAAGARGTSNSFVLVMQRKSSSCPLEPCMPLLVGGEARVSCATSAQCLVRCMDRQWLMFLQGRVFPAWWSV